MANKKQKPHFPSPRKEDFKKISGSLTLSHIITLILIFFVVIGFTMVGTVISAAYVDMPELDPNKVESHAVASYIIDKDGQEIDQLLDNVNQYTVSIDDISPNMRNALIAVEDKRFNRHRGVDPIRILGAAMANLKAGSTVQGGSTLTQQLAGLAMLDRSEKTYKRKIQEAMLALRMERVYTKDEIMSSYLNRVYFGIGPSGNSNYGVEAAARDYFAKPAADLTVDEAAMLAGMIQNPTYWSPLNKPEDAVYRRNVVLQAMADNRYISSDELATYKQAPLSITSSITESKIVTASSNQSYIDAVVEEATRLLGLEKNPQALHSGGYYIHTNLDQDLQSYMYNYFNNDYYFPGYGVQGAMVVMETKTGKIRGIIGGRHQDETQEALFNRAIHAKRQPGSSMKPLAAYGPAFEAGYGTGSVFLDAPYKDDMGHTIKNVDLEYRGNVTTRQAVIDSFNTVAIRVIETVGIPEAIEFCKDCGITTLVEKGEISDMNLSTAIGGLTNGVTVMEMTGAYGAIGNEGMYNKPYFITKITNENGGVIWEEETPSHRAMNEETAWMLTSVMRDSIRFGTGLPATIYDGRPMAGKTGTTDSVKDVWFCGFTPDLTAAVWIGYDTPQTMWTTSDAPSRVFANIMSHAHKGVEVSDFVRPENIVEVYVDTKTGGLATQNTPRGFTALEYFKAGTEPTTYSDNSGLYTTRILVEKPKKQETTPAKKEPEKKEEEKTPEQPQPNVEPAPAPQPQPEIPVVPPPETPNNTPAPGNDQVAAA